MEAPPGVNSLPRQSLAEAVWSPRERSLARLSPEPSTTQQSRSTTLRTFTA